MEEEQDLVLLDRCLRVGSGMMRLVLDHGLGPHAVRIAGSLMAHCPLLDEKLNSIIAQFITCATATAVVLMPLDRQLIHARTCLFVHLSLHPQLLVSRDIA